MHSEQSIVCVGAGGGHGAARRARLVFVSVVRLVTQ
jgi:hypothetical protein